MKRTIALAQIDNVLGDLPKNVAKHLELIRRAKEGGADLVVFPELSLSGYALQDCHWDLALRASDERHFRGILEESKEISILLGAVEESAEFGIFNAGLYFERGALLHLHRKLYPPSYGMFEEQRHFSPGSIVRAFDSVHGRLGVLVCEDLWHLPLPYLLAKDGAQILLAISASPTRLGGREEAMRMANVNLEQHRTIARLLSTYLVFVNRVGFEDGVNFWGGSEVIGPSGDVVVQAKYFEEDLVFAEIDDNEIRRARRQSRHFLDDDLRLVQSELERINRERR